MMRLLPRLGIAASAAAVLVALSTPALHAQESAASTPRWWFGGYLGGNINMFGGQVDDLSHNHPRLVSPGGYDNGSGFGMTLGAIAEYRPGGILGGSVMLGYDNRSIGFASTSAGAAVSDTAWDHEVSTSLSYLSIEPNLRVDLHEGRLHAFGGPSIGINLGKGFTYTAARPADTTVEGDLDDVRSLHVGAQLGVGYDIPVDFIETGAPMIATPFAQLRFGQGHLSPPDGSTTSFGITTVRLGLAVKLGSTTSGSREIVEAESGDFSFGLRVPRHVTASRRVNETFPFRNYIFFEPGSTDIPSRYRRLERPVAGSFAEEQLTHQSSLTGGSPAIDRRERRQMLVYYEALNILGDRMRRNPTASIRLIGAANGSAAQGLEMAESVKRYLVGTFDIAAGRIATDGQPMPPNRSGSGGARGEDGALVAAENFRVVVDGPSEILRPVRISSMQEEPLGNDILITLPSDTMFASWSVELTDGAGAIRTFGPFTGAIGRIPAKPLLDGAMEAGYTARVLATTREGRTERSGTRAIRLERASGTDEQTADRYSILFEFDDSKTVQTYDRFLAETVAPSIPHGAVVVVHGHTDLVGDEEYNAKLSQKRAEETQRILARELAKSGKHVTFDAYGFGEDERRAPFGNERPEHRYYNRTVVIEVVEGE